MRIEDIKALSAVYGRTNGVVQSLCSELLKAHDVIERMASEIADLRMPEMLLTDLAEDETHAEVIEKLFNATPVQP